MKKILKKWIIALTAAILTVSTCAMPITAMASAVSNKTVDPAAARTDFYEAVDGDTIAAMKIPADKSSIIELAIKQDTVDQQMKDYIKGCAASLSSYPKNSDQYRIGALYQCIMDTNGRDAYGMGQTVTGMLQKIDAASSTQELMVLAMQMDRDYEIASLITAGYSSDSRNNKINLLDVEGGCQILSKEVWGSDSSYGTAHRTYIQEYLAALAEDFGEDKETASAEAAELCSVYPVLMSTKQNKADYYNPSNTYNVFKVSDLTGFFGDTLPMDEFCRIYAAEPTDRINITDVGYINALGQLIQQGNLPLLKLMMRYMIYLFCSDVTLTSAQQAGIEYSQKASGAEEPQSVEKLAVSNVESLLSDQCSRAYYENFYDKASTPIVRSMVDKIIALYKMRIQNLDWMQPETKKGAIEKLDNMGVHIGFGGKWPDDIDLVQIAAPADGGNLIDNILTLYKTEQDYSFSRKDVPADRNVWNGINTFTINAFYRPSDNSINIPAAILQDPVFSTQASEEENLGAIGTVIGHELTHAFDTNGAKYDASGNYRNWWTDADLEQFDARAKKVAAYYDGFTAYGYPVHGEQTVTEDIADLGGVSIVTQLAVSEGLDLKKIYQSFAYIWAAKFNEESAKSHSISDIHAPAKTRVNAVLSTIPEFYETYGVVPGDGMYKAPEERASIW
jgi:putative endopeptidase